MKSFAVELTEYEVALIKEHFNLKDDARVRKLLQLWVDQELKSYQIEQEEKNG